MAMRGPLRRERSKYRRGQIGVTPGLAGGRHYVTGAVPGPVHGGYPQDIYMGGMPQQYHPNIHAPAAQSHEYATDPEWESYHVPFSHQHRMFGPFPPAEPEPDFDYDEAQVHSEFFLKAMEAQYRALDEGQEVPTLADLWREHMAEDLVPELGVEEPSGSLGSLDSRSELPQGDLPELWDIAAALGHLQKVLPEDHPDIVNLRAAAREVLEHPERLPQFEDFDIASVESKLGPGNPYEVDLFGEPELQPMADPAPDAFGYGLEQGPGLPVDGYGGLETLLGMSDTGFDGPDGLDQIVEADDPFEMPLTAMGLPDPGLAAMDADLGVGLAAEAGGLSPVTPAQEIDQAIDGALRPPGPPDMDEELDPFLAAQQIFDQQMQYMDNPFMMPGMGPMLGPAPGM